jgi:hypothetical protein
MRGADVRRALDAIEQARREAIEHDDLVDLGYGFKVRERFTATAPLPDRIGICRVTVRMDDGRPLVEHLELSLDPALIAQQFAPLINIRELVDDSVRAEAINMTELHYTPDEITDRRMSRDFADALAAARQARWRRVTPERLREVLDQFADGGISLVMQKQHTSERNARRLLARARKELQ